MLQILKPQCVLCDSQFCVRIYGDVGDVNKVILPEFFCLNVISSSDVSLFKEFINALYFYLARVFASKS